MQSSSRTLLLCSIFVLLAVLISSSHACTCRRMTAEQYLNNSDYSCTFKVLERTEKEEWHAVYYKGEFEVQIEHANHVAT